MAVYNKYSVFSLEKFNYDAPVVLLTLFYIKVTREELFLSQHRNINFSIDIHIYLRKVSCVFLIKMEANYCLIY